MKQSSHLQSLKWHSLFSSKAVAAAEIKCRWLLLRPPSMAAFKSLCLLVGPTAHTVERHPNVEIERYNFANSTDSLPHFISTPTMPSSQSNHVLVLRFCLDVEVVWCSVYELHGKWVWLVTVLILPFSFSQRESGDLHVAFCFVNLVGLVEVSHWLRTRLNVSKEKLDFRFGFILGIAIPGYVDPH